MKICIVDDDKIYQLLMKRMLNMLDKQLSITSLFNGEQALEHLQKESLAYDLVLVDLNMPKMNGWELLDHMKSQKVSTNATIYIATSSIDFNDKKRAESIDIVSGLITKPISKATLEVLVKES